MSKGKIEELVKIKAEYDAKIKGMGKDAISEVYMEFFAVHPKVVAARWTQSTPSFNDGEPCRFGVGDTELKFAKEDNEPDEDDDDDGDDGDDGDRVLRAQDEGFEDAYDHRYEEGACLTSGTYAAKESAFKAIPRIPEDILEHVFGDGKQVTVTRDGEVDVEEYYSEY